MPVKLDGALEIQLALKEFTPNLAKEQSRELRKAAASVVTKARGLVPNNSEVLSGWIKEGLSEGINYRPFPTFDSSTVKRGIKFTDRPTKVNRSGYVYLARIVNLSAAGAIFETAGRRHPNGRDPQPKGTSYNKKEYNTSLNPKAGKQFIDNLNGLGRIKNARYGSVGKTGMNMAGRLIYSAWADDQGKVNAAVIKAIGNAKAKFMATSEWGAK